MSGTEAGFRRMLIRKEVLHRKGPCCSRGASSETSDVLCAALCGQFPDHGAHPIQIPLGMELLE